MNYNMRPTVVNITGSSHDRCANNDCDVDRNPRTYFGDRKVVIEDSKFQVKTRTWSFPISQTRVVILHTEQQWNEAFEHSVYEMNGWSA